MRKTFAVLSAVLLAALCLTGCHKKPQYPLCSSNDDCKEGETCVDGRCVQCKTDSDCPSGIPCVDGVCDKNAAGKAGEGELSAGSVSSPYAECGLDNIYFDFDSSQLKPAAVAALKTVAECLLSKGGKDITIIGHCDPRGTEEYNMGLGLERANTIKKFLVSYGISEGEMKVYSKGEEDAEGSDEAGWEKDRKGEFKENH